MRELLDIEQLARAQWDELFPGSIYPADMSNDEWINFLLSRSPAQLGDIVDFLEWRIGLVRDVEEPLVAAASAWRLGDPAAARQRLTESKAYYQTQGDPHGLGMASQFLGLLALSQGEDAGARAQLNESAAHFQAVDDDWNLANALFILGDVLARSDLEAAQARYEESLTRFRQLGDPWGIAWLLTGLGGIALKRGNAEMARTYFAEGLELRRSLRDTWAVAISLASLGEAALYEGSLEEADAYLAEALDLFRDVDDRERVAWTLHSLGMLSERREDSIKAGACFGESLALLWEQHHRTGVAASLVGLARVAAMGGAQERAVGLLGAASKLREESGITAESDERNLDARLLMEAHTALGQRRFSAAWLAGYEAPIEHLVAVERASTAHLQWRLKATGDASGLMQKRKPQRSTRRSQ